MSAEFKKISASLSSPFSENVQKLASLFPSVIKDGQLDLDELRAQLGDFDEVGREKYGLTWAGKAAAQKKTGEALAGRTLRYVGEESKNADTTQNIYIEGDNLEALKLLQNGYRGRIKMIYIDPPYNTGNDFVYNDSFAESAEDAAVAEGDAAVVDGKVERYAVNTKSSGRYHANWLSMMYPRLQLARNLLSEDGVIFISIDDNEYDKLIILTNEIFGDENHIATFVWKRRSGANDAQNNISLDHEYIAVYARGSDCNLNGIKKTFENYTNPDNDPRGPWARDNLTCGKTASQRPNLAYDIIDPKTGRTYHANPNHVWRFEKEKMLQLIHENKVIFPDDGTGSPAYKRHKGEVRSETKPVSTWLETKLNAVATKELRELFDVQLFDYSKTVDLITQVLCQGSNADSIILDFFSGSATTAHAVMQLNAEDGGNRKFILVQLPELCDEKSEAYKAGYKNICEIGKERIRRAGDKIKAENPLAEIDTGFKVFRVADTNIKWIARELAGDLDIKTAAPTAQTTLDSTISDTQTTRKTKDDIDFMPNTNDTDIIYEILLHQYDIPLTVNIEKLTHIGNRTYLAASTILICLEQTITKDLIQKIAAIEPIPRKIFFRDTAFNDDITLKENTMLRLDALMQIHLTANEKGKLPYTVEFI